MQNVKQTILAQFANSPTLVALINDFNTWIDPSADIDEFYDTIWNVDTATGYGLDVWGRIVGVTRGLKQASSGSFFGFSEGSGQPFGQAPFYPGKATIANVTLGDDTYRQLILLKAAANISNCTIPAINSMLQTLFSGRGRCYAQDSGDMTMRLVFEFALTDTDLSILLYSGVLPRPAGVLLTVIQISTSATFGFSEAGSVSQPFGQGSFFSKAQIQNATV
ncbi:DUF2612 domain-containing protein [Curvibacter lanceolatus]|uniref:DUF2612 domain-containing protein n=1 Tax=Curvibacter lanceolatus TaxID=86182 RepID=UPI00036B0C35|nr:DUF2612 domain-containing protein [Curvibacter lanceolatus]